MNYRSSKEIVDLFVAFSRDMIASRDSLDLSLDLSLVSHRGASGARPDFRVAAKTDDELASVAAGIEERRRAGTEYRDQAVLCVSNSRLNEMAAGLEERGIPVLHLEDLFDRQETKTLLSILTLFQDPFAIRLLTMAQVPKFEMNLEDVTLVMDSLRSGADESLSWRNAWSRIPSLSSRAKQSLRLVSEACEGIDGSEAPWDILTLLLLDRLGMAASIARDGSVRGQMKGIALWQFLSFCRVQPVEKGRPSVRFLERVRRLVLLDEDRELRQLPPPARGLNAVRLMTIHGSKGLEFEAVHIPGLVVSGLSRNQTPKRCYPPDGLIEGFGGLTGIEVTRAGHEQEDECLFFVGISRARDTLFTYAYSQMANGNKRNQSKFLGPFAA